MAVHDPVWLQGKSYAASEDRQLLRGLLNAAGVKRTVGSTTELLVTQTATPSMNVQVATGYACVAGTTSPSTQGTYLFYNDASVTVPITAADASLPRKDLVVAQVNDSAFVAGADSAELKVIPGTPASSPNAPALPANALALAEVLVGAGVTSVSDANITDVRTFWTIANYMQASAVGVPALRLQGRSGQTQTIFLVESSAGQAFFRVGPDGMIYVENGAQIVSAAMRPYQSADIGSSTTTTGTAVQISGSPSGTFVAPRSGAVKISITPFLRAVPAGAYANGYIEVRTGSTVGAGTVVATNVATVTNTSDQWIKATGTMLVDGLTPAATYNYRVMLSRTVAAGTAYGSATRVLIEPCL